MAVVKTECHFVTPLYLQSISLLILCLVLPVCDGGLWVHKLFVLGEVDQEYGQLLTFKEQVYIQKKKKSVENW